MPFAIAFGMNHPAAVDAVSALLATLPPEVLSLSFGMDLDDRDEGGASLSPRMLATVRVPTGEVDWRDVPDGAADAAWTALYDLQDDLRAVVQPFAHLLPVDDLLTVAR